MCQNKLEIPLKNILDVELFDVGGIGFVGPFPFSLVADFLLWLWITFLNGLKLIHGKACHLSVELEHKHIGQQDFSISENKPWDKKDGCNCTSLRSLGWTHLRMKRFTRIRQRSGMIGWSRKKTFMSDKECYFTIQDCTIFSKWSHKNNKIRSRKVESYFVENEAILWRWIARIQHFPQIAKSKKKISQAFDFKKTLVWRQPNFIFIISLFLIVLLFPFDVFSYVLL